MKKADKTDKVKLKKEARKKRFLERLGSKEVLGNVSLACDQLKYSRAQIYVWRNEDSKFADDWDEIVEQAPERKADEAEHGLRKAVLSGNITAIIFTLKSHRPKIYRERYEVTGKGGGAIDHRHTISKDLKGWLIKLAKRELKNEAKDNK